MYARARVCVCAHTTFHIYDSKFTKIRVNRMVFYLVEVTLRKLENAKRINAVAHLSVNRIRAL